MIYPYNCSRCGNEFEIIKSVKQIDDDERCPNCDTIADRFISQHQSFSGASDWDTGHYNPAIGKYVKSNSEARKIARSMGMEEVGTEPVEKIHKKFDTDREDKLEARRNEIFSTSIEVSSR